VIRLSDRIAALQPSATLAIKARAAQLRAEGRDIIDLSAGEPDGQPPVEALEAARQAIRDGKHRYTPVPGTGALREAVAASYRERHGLDVTAANVMITMGGKQALYNLAQSLFNPGDEVILFSPYWVSYPPQLQLAKAIPVVIRTRPEDGFQPDLDEVAAAITARTRAILVNSPSNPTGCVIEVERLRGIAELARQHDLVVISDEIYDAITYDGATSCCMAGLSDDAATRTIIVNAISKTYAMTGWRVGWIVAPVEVVKACSKIQGHSTSGVCEVNQCAAVAAIGAPSAFLEPVLLALDRRRKVLAHALDAVAGIEVGPIPQGAFYLFPRVDGLFGRKTPSGGSLSCALEVAGYLLDEAQVAVVPGEAFGEDRCVRISYATTFEHIEDGARRIAAAVARLD
jgi:aspartate aminotransferase